MSLLQASLDDYRWLVSDAARPWLDRVSEDLAVTPNLIQRLRQDLSADRAHLVVEQVELRRRAREKFSLADRMFFTRKGLEQATDEVLATYKSARFPSSSNALVLDLCCGIGGDLCALGQRNKCIGLDADSIVCLQAFANAKVCNANCQADTVHIDQLASVEDGSAWHCDPDRRVDGHRTTQLEQFEPPLATLDELRRRNPNAAIKLAPATDVPLDWWQHAEREWLGSRGECRQQVAWFGSLARHPGRHAATVVGADGSARTIVGTFGEPIPVAPQLGRYLYEPHAAVLAADLSGVLCREHELAAVSAGIGYLTGDRPITDETLATFEVREVLPFDRKQLRAWCRQHAIGRLEVKKRGLELDPERLRKEVIATGDNAATLIVTPIAGQVRAIIGRRVSEGAVM